MNKKTYFRLLVLALFVSLFLILPVNHVSSESEKRIMQKTYSDSKYGISFQYPSNFEVTKWETQDDMLFSLGVFPVSYDDPTFRRNKPEIAITVFDNTKNTSISDWFEDRVSIDGTFHSNSGQFPSIIFEEVSSVNKLTWGDKTGLIFKESYKGINAIRILLPNGEFIYSFSFMDLGDGFLEDYFSSIVSTVNLKNMPSDIDRSKLRLNIEENIDTTNSSKINNIQPGLYFQNRKSRIAPAQVSGGYKLPWINNTSYLVTQSWNGLSHKGNQYYAYDFGIPEGTPILASKGGSVLLSRGNVSTCGGWDHRNTVNYVVIQHDSQNATQYLHLQSVSVSTGSPVTQGAVIGVSGKTGYTDVGSGCGPHLHFQNQVPNNQNWSTTSQSIYFSEYPGVQLSYLQSYTSQNVNSTCNVSNTVLQNQTFGSGQSLNCQSTQITVLPETQFQQGSNMVLLAT